MSGTAQEGRPRTLEEALADIGAGDDKRPPADYLVYPHEASFGALIPNGVSTVNFTEGKVSLADDTTQQLNGSLKQRDAEYVRSLFLFSDQDVFVAVNKEGKQRPGGRAAVAQLTPVTITDWKHTQVAIKPRDPYDARIRLIASPRRRLPLGPAAFTSAQYREVTDFSTNDNWQTVKQQNLVAYNDKSFRVVNTGSSNDVDVRIQRLLADGNLSWRDETTTTLSPGDDWAYNTGTFARAWRVQVQNATQGQNTTVNYEGGGVA